MTQTMNTPAQTLTFSEAEFRTWLESLSFANHGDKPEQDHHALLKDEFPRNELFWRSFVVPLTKRLSNDHAGPRIHFRDGVDPLLQNICGANYSLFVHLAFAKRILEDWNDTSLDAIYTRLASAFDVFEGVVIKFHVLLCECAGGKSPLLDELSRDAFLKLAGEFYDEHYPTLRQHYLTIGKKPPAIEVPTRPSLLNEFFKGHPRRAEYHTTSGQIRAFRNAIVHDVRVGMLTTEDGSTLVPKPSCVWKYRQWHQVQHAATDSSLVAKDFCEVKTQCQTDVCRSIEIINALYEVIVDRFKSEFFSAAPSRLRDYFGVTFAECGSAPPPARSRDVPIERSESFAAPRKQGNGVVDTNISGVFVKPAKEHPGG